MKVPLLDELDLPLRKRIRSYGSTNHLIHLNTQLWQRDWYVYEKPGTRVDFWAKV